MAEGNNTISLDSFEEPQRQFIENYAKEFAAKNNTDISVPTALNFLEKSGMKAFATEEEYKSAKIGAAKDIARNWENDARKQVKELTSVGWDDEEKLPDYINRAFNEAVTKKGKKEFNLEFETIKTEKAKLANALASKEDEIKQYKEQQWNEKVNNSISGVVNKVQFSVPDGLSDEDKSILLDTKRNNIVSLVKENFEFKADPTSGTPYIQDKNGNAYSDIAKTIGEYLKSNDFSFSKPQENANGKFKLPDGKGRNTDEAKKIATEKVNQQLREKGIMPNSPKAWALKINEGLYSLDDIKNPNFRELVRKQM